MCFNVLFNNVYLERSQVIFSELYRMIYCKCILLSHSSYEIILWTWNSLISRSWQIYISLTPWLWISGFGMLSAVCMYVHMKVCLASSWTVDGWVLYTFIIREFVHPKLVLCSKNKGPSDRPRNTKRWVSKKKIKNNLVIYKYHILEYNSMGDIFSIKMAHALEAQMKNVSFLTIILYESSNSGLPSNN
jgi:hypothetical protein